MRKCARTSKETPAPALPSTIHRAQADYARAADLEPTNARPIYYKGIVESFLMDREDPAYQSQAIQDLEKAEELARRPDTDLSPAEIQNVTAELQAARKGP